MQDETNMQQALACLYVALSWPWSFETLQHHIICLLLCHLVSLAAFAPSCNQVIVSGGDCSCCKES